MNVTRDRLLKLIEPVVQQLGFELWCLEFSSGRGRSTLRLVIDRPAGIDLEACEVVSRQVSAILDVEDPLPGDYTLEVSSPGMDRRLVKPEHYDRFVGHQVTIRLKQLIEGRRKLAGRLAGRDGCMIRVEPEEGLACTVALDDIDVARLVPEF